MSGAAEFQEGCGAPTIRVSERFRQLVAFLVVILSLSSVQIGLIQLTPGLAVPSAKDNIDHTLLLSRSSTTQRAPPPADHLVTMATSGVVVLTSTCGVLVGVLMRTRNRRRRRQAVIAGYVYVLAEIGAIAMLVYCISQQKPHEKADKDLEKHYRGAFANAMWDYMYDSDLKRYIDTVQQEYQCCGAYRYTDWYLTDWLRPELYANRYYMMLAERRKLAKKKGEPWYDIQHYGMPMVQRNMIPLLTEDESTWSQECGLFVNEVPFSCCDPATLGFCRQMFANRKQHNFIPGKDNNTLHSDGCGSKVVDYLLSRHRDPVHPPLWAPLAVKAVALLLYRLLQTSAASGLAAGRHLSAAPGWLVLIRPTRGQASASKPLLDGESSDADDESGTSESAPTPPDGDSQGGDDTDNDDVPPPPPMD